MLTKITLTLFLMAGLTAAIDMERFLQTQGSIYTATCTADSSCSTGNCCADFKKISGTTTTSVLKTCVSTQLHNKVVFYNNLNYTWACINTATVTANTPASCSANTDCNGTTNGCCLQKSFQLWTVDSQSIGNYCGVQTTATYQQYNVGSSPNNFTANVTFSGACMADPVPVNTTTDNNSTNTVTTSGAFSLAMQGALALIAITVSLLL